MKTGNYFEFVLNEAMKGIEDEDGAPFGACIVHNGEIIALAHDTVLKDNDATCHAEMNAIRSASKALKTYQLHSCIIYCTSEPCPMCLSAIHWSGIQECHFIADRKLSASYGFDDDLLYNELTKPILNRNMRLTQQSNYFEEVKTIFNAWEEKGLPIC